MANNYEHKNCNGDNHNHKFTGIKHSKESSLALAFWLNLFFSIVELIGGILTNSTAIIADAFHDFMDAGAIGLAILLENVSDKKRTAKFSYGYKRFFLLAALGLSIFLLAGSVTMVFAAYNSFLNPKEIHSVGMLWLAVLGLAVNGFAFLRIKNDGGHYHQGHSHGGHNHNSQSIMLHLFEDVLGWAVVLIGAAIIHFTGWNWIDGFLTIAIALYIGFNASKNLINTLKVMLQSVPENVNLSQLETDLHQIEGITNIHDVHVWSLDGSYNVGSLHAVVNNATGKTEQDILNKIIKLMGKHRIQHPTVQIETNFNSCQLKHC
ncbi:cobalt-zinc-cadmium efflux system protein [Salegentibacter agarivorans]|uniref:Cobalt-zinc-cadmium efflux system protein n=1 Tax=Salegentibacter agarivorans TaxID=345907 RepID=A0A1I2N7E2_9FLAO|nr:cation diffusion facilitator family transporter [Salegentibacter agarivorans]SFF98769.1 cobalt-zinc-cadmium efflux system protein [Salegentibacter agarivorans]